MVRCTIRAALLLSWALLVTVADAGVPGVTRDSVRIATIQEIPTLDASGLAALILLLAAGALTILVRRRTGHRR